MYGNVQCDMKHFLRFMLCYKIVLSALKKFWRDFIQECHILVLREVRK